MVQKQKVIGMSLLMAFCGMEAQSEREEATSKLGHYVCADSAARGFAFTLVADS